MKSLAKAAAGAISLLVVSYATAMGEPATWIGADAFSMGALLVDIKPGGPADRAGLKPGDFIYRFDNKGVPSMAALFELVHATPAGKAVEIYFLRGEQQLHVNLTVEALPGAREPEGPLPDSIPIFDDPKSCTPEFRALAGRC